MARNIRIHPAPRMTLCLWERRYATSSFVGTVSIVTLLPGMVIQPFFLLALEKVSKPFNISKLGYCTDSRR
jgi:hypothetical protein